VEAAESQWWQRLPRSGNKKISSSEFLCKSSKIVLNEWWQDTREALRAGFNNDSLQKERTLN